MQDRRELRRDERAPATPARLDLVRAEADLLRSEAFADVAMLISRKVARLLHRRPAAA